MPKESTNKKLEDDVTIYDVTRSYFNFGSHKPLINDTPYYYYYFNSEHESDIKDNISTSFNCNNDA